MFSTKRYQQIRFDQFFKFFFCFIFQVHYMYFMESLEKIENNSMCISNQCYYCGNNAPLANITTTYWFFTVFFFQLIVGIIKIVI